MKNVSIYIYIERDMYNLSSRYVQALVVRKTSTCDFGLPKRPGGGGCSELSPEHRGFQVTCGRLKKDSC